MTNITVGNMNGQDLKADDAREAISINGAAAKFETDQMGSIATQVGGAVSPDLQLTTEATTGAALVQAISRTAKTSAENQSKGTAEAAKTLLQKTSQG